MKAKCPNCGEENEGLGVRECKNCETLYHPNEKEYYIKDSL